MIPLALQLYEYRDGPMIADLSDATACKIDNGLHGFRSLTCFVPMSLELAFYYAQLGMAKWISLNYGAGAAWEGRVEDLQTTISDGQTGLGITAFGSWRAMYDVPYTALWSVSGTAGWRVVTGDDDAARTPSRFEMDNNNRLFVGLKKNMVYGAGNKGSWMAGIPDGSDRLIKSVTFDYSFLASSDYQARMVGNDYDFASGSAEWTLTGTGSTLAGSRTITLATPNEIVLFEINCPSGATYSGETGAHCLKITNVRLVTSVANKISTNLSAAITSTGSQTVTVVSTAGMYVGQSLIVAQNTDGKRERVVVTAVNSATQFTATFTNTHVISTGIEADAIYADQIVSDLVAHVTAVNSDQLSTNTILIESPGVDLLDELYEDAWPGDIATKLAALGDNQDPPRQWEVGVWENQILHFRPKGSGGGEWAVDADEMDINSTLDLLRNSTYAIYQDANGRTLRTAVSDDDASQSRYGIVRRKPVTVRTTSATQASKHRDALLNDSATIKPRSGLVPDYLMTPAGAIVPKWLARAGQTINIRNLPPTLGAEVDRIRTFIIGECSYDAITDELQPVPEEPPTSLEFLIAREAKGL